MTKPKRIQLKHTKGWKLPPNTVSVSGFSKWANPYKAPKDGSRMEVVELYKDLLLTYPQTLQGFLETDSYIHTLKQELGGKDLACWCPLDVPCHADVLLELAREMDERRGPCVPTVMANAELRGAKPIGEASLSNDVLGADAQERN